MRSFTFVSKLRTAHGDKTFQSDTQPGQVVRLDSDVKVVK